MKTKKIIIGVLVVIAVFAITFVGARLTFSRTAKEKLLREAQMQVLRFESQLNGEIKLVLQMAKSPVVIRFLEKPDDEFYSVAGVNEVRLYQESFLGKSSFWASTYDDVFWSDCAPVYKIDKEDPSQYWYKMTLYETDVYNFNINYNADIQRTNLWLNAVVRNEAGNPIGVCGTGIPLDEFINGLFASIQSDPTLSMFMFNNLAEVTGAMDKSLVENKTHIGDVLHALEQYQTYSDETRYISSFGNEYILMAMPTVGWTLVLGNPFNIAAFFESAAMPFGLLVVVIFVIALIIFSRRLFRPLNALNKTVRDLGSDNADLTKRITMKLAGSLPVIIELVDGFNSFIEKTQNTVKILKESEDRIESSRIKLNSGTKNTVSSIEEISSDIDNFTQRIKKQSASVQQTASAVEQISSNIGSLNNMISTQSVAVSDASSAIEQMLGNIKSVNSSVEKLSSSFAVLEQETAQGVAKHETMNEQITEIKDQSTMLADANKVISAIANQTNLLAMNAAIEAAHAGEAGKGFSVVADEIRKLSEDSSKQSKTISQRLKEIQNSIETVVVSSTDAGHAFQGVSNKIDETNNLVRQIAQAMTEQESGSKQISDSILTLNNSSAEVRAASQEMNEGSKTILNEIKFLQDTTIEMDSSMEELDKKGLTLKDTQGALASLSKDVDEAIGQMHTSLEMFKV